MLKINKDEYLNEDMIECVAEYGSKPIVRHAMRAKAEGREREFRNSYGLNTVIVLSDGTVCLCPNKFETYMGRLDADRFVVADPKRFAVAKAFVKEATTSPNLGQRRDVAKAKEEGRYLNFARGKSVKWTFFTVTGRIYGTHAMKADLS